MQTIKEQILELRSCGMSYREIEKIVGCSKGTIAYHLGDGQKTKVNTRKRKYRESSVNILKQKMSLFLTGSTGVGHTTNSSAKIQKIVRNKICSFVRVGNMTSSEFNFDDLLLKVGESPKCYLTGTPIDLSKSSTYHFDHIVPRSRGGDNSLNNLGICISKANMAKSDMLPNEFFDLCKLVLENNGFMVSEKQST
jgi:5-methylcytosine-specific restriction endonuclease McrA